jgi:hypothetical protein
MGVRVALITESGRSVMRKVLLAIVLTASSAFDTPTTAVTEGFAARGPEIVSVGNDVYPSSTTIMMAVYGDGIFKSTDSGAALTESNAGLPNGNVIWINRNLAALPAH